MTLHAQSSPMTGKSDPTLSLYNLLDQEVLATPYSLYHRLRSEDPVHWDPFLHAWVVTRYADVVTVFLGGQETTTNLIGNGLLSLLRHPDQLERLQADLSLIPSAVEELLRFESPSQQTARLAPEDVELGGKLIRQRQAVIAVMGAANRDPERFAEPDRLDIGREDNRHVAFAWGAHFCFGSPLARIEGQAAFEAIVRRMPEIKLATDKVTWRGNLGLRGLTTLPVTFWFLLLILGYD